MRPGCILLNFNRTKNFSFTNMHLKMHYTNYRPLCTGLNMAIARQGHLYMYYMINHAGKPGAPQIYQTKLWSEQGLFYEYGLTLIPASISTHMHNNGWDGITYPFSNFNGSTFEVFRMDKWFHPTLYCACNYLSMSGCIARSRCPFRLMGFGKIILFKIPV